MLFRLLASDAERQPMWKPTEPIIIRGRELGLIESWRHLFVQEWEAREPAPDELNTSALYELILPVYHQYYDRDPVAVAAQMFGTKPEWDTALYPRTHAEFDFDDVPF